ncbi:medium-chain fatty acid-CoA ligase faa2, partial [Linderina pennispora]
MQVYVHGDSLQSKLVSVAVPDPETFVPWACKLVGNPGTSFARLCIEKMVVDKVLSVLSKHGKQARLQGYETIRKLHLDHRPFDVETNGILTSTSKLKQMQA